MENNTYCVVYQDESVKHDGPTYITVGNLKEKTQKRLENKVVKDVGYGNQNVVHITCMDGLASAMHMAYGKHNSFTWSPDALWLRICQALATHIKMNSVKLNSKIVGFEGKKKLHYRNDSFIMNRHNPWDLFFDSMANQIGENTNGPIHELFTKPFSTTTKSHTAAANGMLMNACSDYFSFTCITECGIPEFRFSGTPQDWMDLSERCNSLNYYGMEDWLIVLKPIISEFVNASYGQFNVEFWRDMYKVDGGSGGPYISGWVNQLYPYLDNGQENPYLYKNPRGSFYGLTTNSFPSGLSSVPFEWDYLGTKYDMELVVGALGVHQDKDNGSLTPAYGWVFVENKS
jgi:hypothetical protein